MRIRTKLLKRTVFFSALAPSLAFAFGSAKPGPEPYTLPNPDRTVILRPVVGIEPFENPNGASTAAAEIQTELLNDVQGAVSASGSHLSYYEGPLSGLPPCGTHLEIEAAVEDFILDDTTINVQFGFGGGTSVATGITANAQDTVTLGDMNFLLTLFECDNATDSMCSTLFSVTVDQSVLGNSASFQIGWNQITAQASILSNVQVNEAVQSILGNAVQSLEASPSMATVPWSAVVESVNPQTGAVQFAAGQDQGILTNQYFTVYSGLSSSNSCGVLEPLACIATASMGGEVDNDSSIGVVYRTLQGGVGVPIQAGDVVMVGDTACAPSSSGN